MVSACLFLLFDATVLGLSYWIAKEVESDAIAINIAGRQRMLSQRMTKSLLQLQAAGDAQGVKALLRNELRAASETFDTTLRAFKNGGYVDAADGRRVYQEPLEGGVGQGLVQQALTHWVPFYRAIQPILQTKGAVSPASIDQAVILATDYNLTLLDFSNRITNYKESTSRSKTERLRLLQVVAFTFALFNFAVMLYSLWRRMRALQGTQEVLQRQAESDPLTGLPNRNMLVRRLQAAIDKMVAQESALVVAFLDLNEFKPVNDIYGHAAGDAVLKSTAKRLQSRLRHSDLIARHGGDEFVVVLEDIESLDQVRPLLDELVEALEVPVKLEDKAQVSVGVSIGAVIAESEAVSPEQLLHASDQLMYRVKRRSERRWLLARFVAGSRKMEPVD